MPNSKQIVYLSQAQYQELITNGTITVDGVTVQYDENDIYVTPQAEPVTDVRVAGMSVAANGVANVPMASHSVAGVAKVTSDSGITIRFGDRLAIMSASESIVKSNTSYYCITPNNKHHATFYGLAEAAGDTTQSQSSNSTGTYTPEAKGAIQKMLGVSNLIATEENNLVASKAYAAGEVFTANGKLYKATTAIAQDAAIIPAVEGEEITGANCEETSVGEGFVKKTDIANSTTPGLVRINGYGLALGNSGNTKDMLYISYAGEQAAKLGISYYNPIVPHFQDRSVFYGLSKVAGVDLANETVTLGTYPETSKVAIRTMLGAVGDVQVNGTSVVTSGVAEIPRATNDVAGVVKLYPNGGIQTFGTSTDGLICLNVANDQNIRLGIGGYNPITPDKQHKSIFYGLAKAAGDTTQSKSSNAVGTYTDNAKASIKAMLGIQDGSTGTVDVTGVTPTITAVENTRYVCGEVTSLSFTPPASGISIVRFTSGSTVTVLTIPSTVKFPEWFDPTSLETNTIYEICVTDGEFGAVMSWPL